MPAPNLKASRAELPARVDRWHWFAIATLAIAGFVAYSGSLHGPLVFDDIAAIVDNASIRHLTDVGHVLTPPTDNGITVGGRPLLNLSFAINYASGGYSVVGFHLANLLIHLAAALTLYGIVRRTIARFSGANIQNACIGIGIASALLWLAHPLQTESVTYVVQRAESLMGLCYLLTLYGFIRGAESNRNGWFVVAAISCACGMATKEVMVSAPIVVLLYDRTFIGGSWREAWRRHGRAHAALFATWLLLAYLVWSVGDRGGTIGPTTGIAWWQYAFCQARAVWRYIGLSLWPHPLVLDYGSDFVSGGDALPFLIIDALGITGVAFGLWRGHRWAFLAAASLVILAPSSSVVGGTRQMLAEHRMYLPLAGVTIGLTLLGFRAGGRRALFGIVALAIAMVFATAVRNRVYQTDLRLWADTAAKRPQNAAAHGNLGLALQHANHPAEALAEYELAVRLNPSYADVHNNLGNLLFTSGRTADGIAEVTTALTLRPNFAEAEANLGSMLVGVGRPDEGIPHLERAVQMNPNRLDAQNNLAIALVDNDRIEEAIARARIALQVDPHSAEARNTLGVADVKLNRLADAAVEFDTAVRLDPQYERARRNLAAVQAAIQKQNGP